MAVPDFQSLMLPVLRAMANGEISSAELRDKVASDLELGESDLAEMLPSGRQTTFANRIAWANIFLQRAGLIEKVRRGVYRISQEGRNALASNPPRIDMHFLERYPAYVEWRRRSVIGTSSENEPLEVGHSSNSVAATPEEQIERSHQALTSALEADVLDRLLELSPTFFETLIVDLLIAMGYGGGRSEMGKAVGKSGDGGIDGIVKEDALGLDVVYMQAKRYARENSVGRQEVQSFAGSLDGHRATKGIFFTTSSFTRGATEFSEKISKRIILIDGLELARLMVRHNVGVRTRTTYEIKKVDEDYFAE
jgi:restriction system protein